MNYYLMRFVFTIFLICQLNEVTEADTKSNTSDSNWNYKYLTVATAATHEPESSNSEADLVNYLMPKSSTTIQGELVAKKIVSLTGRLEVIFPTKLDSYVILKPEASSFLIENPIIDVPNELDANITSLVAKPSKISFGGGLIDGFEILCTIDITTIGVPKPGQYTVIVALPTITQVARALGAIPPQEMPTLTFDVHLYESEEALERAKKEERALLEKVRLEEEAASAERQKWLGISATGVLFLWLTIAHIKSWLAPRHQITVRRGSTATASGSVEITKRISEEKLSSTDIQPFSEKKSARSFLGIKADIIVNIDAISADRSVDKITTTTTYDGGGSSVSVSYKEVVKYQVIIAATADWQAKPGRYLARTSAGTVRIHVV